MWGLEWRWPWDSLLDFRLLSWAVSYCVQNRYLLLQLIKTNLAVADLIAMGIVFAYPACGGPTIPFRMGRIDATSAGPPGVPEPQQELSSHIESFRRQGFSQSEMIGLVACGHTLGGVRAADFPTVGVHTGLDLFNGNLSYSRQVCVAISRSQSHIILISFAVLLATSMGQHLTPLLCRRT